MNKINVGVIFTFAILLVLMAAGSAAAAPPLQDIGDPDLPRDPDVGDPDVPRDPEPESGGGDAGGGEPKTEIIGPVTDGASLNGSGPDEANPAGTAIRINFEVAGHTALRGLYVVQETGGHVIASWYALEGWTDSGWIENVDISGEYVQLRVFYYSGPNTKPTEMRILNHAPGSAYGWASHGIGHAIEVAWPDMELSDRNF